MSGGVGNMMDMSMMNVPAGNMRLQQSSYTTDNIPVEPNQNTNDDVQMGPGAGPLPTGWGQPTQTASTLTEFTKRRNWTRLVLEQMRDLYLILSPELRMQYISPSVGVLTGYQAEELKSKFLQDFVHQEDRAMVLREINECIASRQQLRFFYRFKKRDEQYAIFEAFGHPHFTSDARFGSGNPGAKPCGGIFIMSRPYPTKNAQLLDSLLEHKIENERLLRKIAELKREEQEELEQQGQQQMARGGGSLSTFTRSDNDTDIKPELTDNGSMYDGMPPPPKPGTSNMALTRQNLNEALAASLPDSINDKMARYEGATPMEHIEMLTGLRNGERSDGISTGAMSPHLVKGDAGIAILADRENRGLEKKKKIKLADEYVCTDCGTLDSPEWRKGPSGPKTLCNACGCKFYDTIPIHVC